MFRRSGRSHEWLSRNVTQHYDQPIYPDLAEFCSRTTGFLKMNFFNSCTKKLCVLIERTNRNVAFLIRVVFHKNMAANSEANVNKINLMAWPSEMELQFIEQVKNKEFSWKIESRLYYKKDSICYVDKYFISC